MPLVGYVSSASADASYMAAFRQGLADLGHIEGRNAAIEFRWADGKFERLPALFADLIQRRVAVIAVGGITSGLAAKAATMTIPIVFLAADDPVKFGLVTSLNRPGGNATGLNLLTSELSTKRLELIRDLVPTASAVAVLVNPRSPESEPQTRDIERVAGAVGQQSSNSQCQQRSGHRCCLCHARQTARRRAPGDERCAIRPAAAIKSSRWRRAVPFPRSTTGGPMPTLEDS